MADKFTAGAPGPSGSGVAPEGWRLAHEIPFSWKRLDHAWEVFIHLVALQLRLLYKGSWLGLVYTLFNPIVQLVVFSLIFSRVMTVNTAPYPLFLYCGLLCWNAFSESLGMAAGAIVGSRNLVHQPGFPPLALPVVVVAIGLVQFALSLSIMAALLVYFRPALGWSLAALPLLIGIQTLLILALAFPLAALQVRFHDVKQLLAVGLRFLFFLTPILYATDRFPDTYHLFFAANPLTHLIEAYRAIFMYGVWPDWTSLSAVAAVSSIALILGFRFFQLRRFQFIEDL